ncbi:hypothetical protein [Acinetobacter soli]|uniref:hypothetical protein n=1 Tax=Acinetobacter soli TaxID=487316 RepID=UPI00125042CB|nr:hypothetical protein [Acinetobacter soli]
MNLENEQNQEVKEIDTPEIEPETEETAETVEGDDQADQPEVGEGENEEDDFKINLGDEQESESEEEFNGKPAPQWVKDLRVEAKESKRKIKELEEQLKQKNQPVQQQELGEKPTLESCGYDSEQFEVELLEWNERKRHHDEQAKKQQEEQEQVQKGWEEKLQSYEAKKSILKQKAKDFDDAEQTVRDVLDVNQQGIVIYSEKPELLVYNLGRNPEKARQLAAIKNPLEFAFQIGKHEARIDAQMKSQTRKPQTNPERKPSGSAPLATTDATLAALEKEAERTGDRTKLIAYKKSLKK